MLPISPDVGLSVRFATTHSQGPRPHGSPLAHAFHVVRERRAEFSEYVLGRVQVVCLVQLREREEMSVSAPGHFTRWNLCAKSGKYTERFTIVLADRLTLHQLSPHMIP